MTEIALALAMGFFSLMVLTLVSMGSGIASDQEAVTAQMATPTETSRPGAITKIRDDELLVIYYGGRLLNRELIPVEPEALKSAQRTVLALPPDIPLRRGDGDAGAF